MTLPTPVGGGRVGSAGTPAEPLARPKAAEPTAAGITTLTGDYANPNAGQELAVLQNMGLGVSDTQMAVTLGKLSSGYRAELALLGKNLDAQANVGLSSTWASTVARGVREENLNEMDVGAIMLLVLRESYVQGADVLREQAARVKFFNNQKAALREHTAEVRKLAAELNQHLLSQHLDPAHLDAAGLQVVSQFMAGKKLSGKHAKVLEELGLGELPQTPAELEVYLQKCDEILNTLGDDSQMANLELQNQLQRIQQDIQSMSNVSKVMYDTGMGVIRKIGGG